MVCSSNHRRFCVSILALTVFCWLSAGLPSQAQVTGATISGTVLDNSGSTIPNAKVTVTNADTGISRDVTTNTDGFFTVPNLIAGTYTLKFTAQGFRTEEKSGIVLSVGASPVVNVTMQVGAATEIVQVQTEAPAVQLASSDISAVVNATTVRELPLNGRSWTDLASLQPGVDTIHTQPDFSAGTDRGNRGFGQQLTISGARPQQNNYRLDGVSINDYANGAPGSVLGGSLGVDAIQEFSVLTSNYSAEYGKTSGGVINAITRNGTNEWHGSAYEFLRNSALDTRNYFDGNSVPPFKRNQFGGALGGPIIKNKTFFFADYEGIRQSKGISVVTTVPSLAARGGTIDPKAAQFLTFYPLPQAPDPNNADFGQFTFAGQQVVNENFLTTRVDHKFSDKDALFGTYLFDQTPYSSPDGLNNVEFDTKTSRQIFATEETHTFSPTFVNSVRLGVNHELVDNNKSAKAINPDAARLDLGSFPGRAAPQVLIGGGITDFTGGVGGSPTYLYRWHSFQLYDDAFLTKGTHSIRFGVAAERLMLHELADTDPNGIWRFTDLAGFFNNQPKKFQGGLTSTLSPRNLRQTIFGAYIQDDWRWRTNLTLNLGLRYEMSSVPTETAGKIANLRSLTDPLPVCGRLVSGCSSSGSFFNNPTLRNFEPRLGFAWDPFHNGKTAVRGGVGLFDVLPLIYQYILLTNQAAPFFTYISSNAVNQGDFYQNAPGPQTPPRSTFVEPNPKRNYVAQWNLNVQQQLTPSLAAMVAYVGSRGIHQPFRVDESNIVIPQKTSAGYVWPFNPADGTPLPTLNQNYSSIRAMFYDGHSYYNAFEGQVAKRMSHGVQVQGTFTWAKSMDTSSATIAGDSFGNSISSLHYFDMSLSRGLSDFNVGRTLVINGSWELPAPKSQSAFAQHALGGWELGLIFTASDGVPVTPTWGTGSDPANTNSSDDWAFPNRLGGPGCKTLTRPGNVNNYIKSECFQVPTAPTPQYWSTYCNPMPNSLVDSNGNQIVLNNPQNPALDGAPWLPAYPCFNLRGNAGRNIITSPGVTELDFSVFKNNYIKSISERFNVQFRAEIFNILNHANFAPPITPTNTDIFDGTGALGAPGVLTKTTTTAREIQFAIKVVF